jgi:two-component system nitrate/nitrite response regulator NarL
MTDLRVLVVADDLLARAGLAALLAQQPGCAVVGQVAGGASLSAELEALRPDVVAWDMGWEPTAAMERLAGLGDGRPPVVALLPAPTYAAEAWANGARGILLRDADVASLSSALAAAAQGLAVLAPELALAVFASRARAQSAPDADLTPRELEVLRLMAEGISNKSIAYRLDISEHTVKFHVNSILRKLDAQSRTEAVINATRQGFVPV